MRMMTRGSAWARRQLCRTEAAARTVAAIDAAMTLTDRAKRKAYRPS